MKAFLLSIGFWSCENHPCLFMGNLLDGEPPIYVGLYVDDLLYFSPSDTVEKHFETLLSQFVQVKFMGQVSHFLGIEFKCMFHDDGNLSVTLTLQSFAENLIDSLHFDFIQPSMYTTPYRSGFPVDTIPHVEMSSPDRDAFRLQYQSIVGSLNWLAHTTHPDLSTIVSMLAQHQCNPSPGHLEAAHYVVRYLAGTKGLGIYFSSSNRPILESFLHFPLPQPILSMVDANWGPQDASMNMSCPTLPPFVSRSMSAFYIDLLGPLHWISKRQTVTACSSTEAEIYATDECMKFLLELDQLLQFPDVKRLFMPSTTTIYNDNKACVNWSSRCTTKGLRHIQMKENRIRENIAANFVEIVHIDGKLNIANIFTKEMRDTTHFVALQSLFMCVCNHAPNPIS